MFCCEECRIKKGWPKGLSTPSGFGKSKGPCGVCGKIAICHNVPSEALPDPKPKKPKKG